MSFVMGISLEKQTGTPVKHDWTARELAEAIGLTDSRIRQLLLSGEIEGFKRGPLWFITDKEVQRLIADRENR